MAKLQNYNGHYCESEYENAFISFLEEEGWQYLAGNSMGLISGFGVFDYALAVAALAGNFKTDQL